MSSQSLSRIFRAVKAVRNAGLYSTGVTRARIHTHCYAALRRVEYKPVFLYPYSGEASRQFSTQQKPDQKSDGSKKSESDDDKKQDGDDGDNSEQTQKLLKMLIASYVGLYIVSMILPNKQVQNEDQLSVSWSEFYHNMLAKGEVAEIIINADSNVAMIKLVDGAIVKGKPAGKQFHILKTPDLEQFEAKLRKAEQDLGVAPGSIPITYRRSKSADRLVELLVLIVLVGLFVRASAKSGNFKGVDMFSQMTKPKFTVVDHNIEATKPNVRFADVAGCHGAKQEIGEFIDYLQDSAKYKKLGAKYPKGVLLLGPPGCGKTMLAKAVAAEAKVPFLAMAGSEFIEIIGGVGAKRVRSLFAEARKRSPCIIYIDEIDAIGRVRSETGSQNHSEEEQTLNQLLVEMDGMASKDGVIMLASTNRAEILDKALLRPGRFDRHILIDLPNQAERIEIFDKHLASIVLDKSPSSYSKRLAELTPGFSGADIANVCNEAALHAARTRKRAVSKEDIDYAVDRVVGGTEKKTHAMTPEERKRVAVHECGHAIVAWLLEHTEDLLKISIVPRTKGALGMATYVNSDQKLYTTEQLYEKICMALGGRAAEIVVYGQPSTGAQDDLQKVTKIAKAIVENYGMDTSIGPLSYDERRPYSKTLANTLDHRAAQLVQQAFKNTVKLVKKNRSKLQQLADELVRKEVLEYKDVEAILGPRPYPKKS